MFQMSFPIALKLFAKTFLIGSINRALCHMAPFFFLEATPIFWFTVEKKKKLSWKILFRIFNRRGKKSARPGANCQLTANWGF